jgi:hypothetical protein
MKVFEDRMMSWLIWFTASRLSRFPRRWLLRAARHQKRRPEGCHSAEMSAKEAPTIRILMDGGFLADSTELTDTFHIPSLLQR